MGSAIPFLFPHPYFILHPNNKRRGKKMDNPKEELDSFELEMKAKDSITKEKMDNSKEEVGQLKVGDGLQQSLRKWHT